MLALGRAWSIFANMKTAIFIGRFQPFHEGHRKCVEKVLQENDRCILMLRDTEKTEKNPFELAERKAAIRAHFPDESRLILQTLEDPGAHLSVYIGRDVGYDLIQLDAQTESISATDIRKKLYEEAGKAYDPAAPAKVR